MLLYLCAFQNTLGWTHFRCWTCWTHICHLCFSGISTNKITWTQWSKKSISFGSVPTLTHSSGLQISCSFLKKGWVYFSCEEQHESLSNFKNASEASVCLLRSRCLSSSHNAPSSIKEGGSVAWRLRRKLSFGLSVFKFSKTILNVSLADGGNRKRRFLGVQHIPYPRVGSKYGEFHWSVSMSKNACVIYLFVFSR